jgi:hypothetical protein
LRGAAALRFLLGVLLVPACPRDGSGVWAAIDEFAPDVLVVDQQALAGAVVAERAGLLMGNVGDHIGGADRSAAMSWWAE